MSTSTCVVVTINAFVCVSVCVSLSSELLLPWMDVRCRTRRIIGPHLCLCCRHSRARSDMSVIIVTTCASVFLIVIVVHTCQCSHVSPSPHRGVVSSYSMYYALYHIHETRRDNTSTVGASLRRDETTRCGTTSCLVVSHLVSSHTAVGGCGVSSHQRCNRPHRNDMTSNHHIGLYMV